MSKERLEGLKEEAETSRPRILMWDIEAEDLKADWGEMICYAIKPLGEEPYAVSTLDFRKRRRTYLDWDKEVVRQAVKDLSEADAVVTWYGWRSDRRFLNARCAYYGFDPIPPSLPHIDCWRTAKDHMGLSSNRLNNVQDFFKLATEKTPLEKDTWRKARRGHRDSSKYVVDHCLADVIVLEEAYLKLRPYMPTHPNVNLMIGSRHSCPKCGAGQEYVGTAGVHYATTRCYIRVRCSSCGSECLTHACPPPPREPLPDGREGRDFGDPVMAEEKPASLAKRRQRGKQARLLRGGHHLLAELRPAFEDYVRWHRLVHEVDPDTEEVSNEWPEEEA